VRLQRWGTLTGRLVDARGLPLADVRVALRYPDLPRLAMPPPEEVRTGRDGRFRIEELLPGLEHVLILAPGPQKEVTLTAGEALTKLKTREGEVKDLGDIPVKVVAAPNKEGRKDG
jgi:hypothetical protein